MTKSPKEKKKKDNATLLENALNEWAYKSTKQEGINGAKHFILMCLNQAKSNANLQSTVLRHILGTTPLVDQSSSTHISDIKVVVEDRTQAHKVVERMSAKPKRGK